MLKWTTLDKFSAQEQWKQIQEQVEVEWKHQQKSALDKTARCCVDIVATWWFLKKIRSASVTPLKKLQSRTKLN